MRRSQHVLDPAHVEVCATAYAEALGAAGRISKCLIRCNSTNIYETRLYVLSFLPVLQTLGVGVRELVRG